jgi:steroid 5-alpha reductase family enzyme
MPPIGGRLTRTSRATGFAVTVVTYLAAGLAALGTAYAGRNLHPLVTTFIADLVATVVVFIASTLVFNASLYDPYWSVAPPVVVGAWLLLADGPAPLGRRLLVAALVLGWAVRLTANWARSWSGLQHEDWRYTQIREQTAGRPPWWVVNLTGIQLMPTVVVYVGLLAVWPAVVEGARPLGWLDAIAVLVTIGAIAVESIADRQLQRFTGDPANKGQVADLGLWQYSRHPNYVGEIGFWCGLWLFALAAAPSYWWTVIGPLTMFMLFNFVSVPMMDARSLARRETYADHMARVPALFPAPWRLRRPSPS